MDLSDYLNLQPKQQTAIKTLFDPNCKYLLYGGAMAGGKSFVLRWAALLYLIYLYHKYHIKNIPVGLFSEDYPTLKDRQIARIKREFPPQIGELKDTRDEGLTYTLRDELGGGRIMLRNLDDPSKYMSTEFAGEFVEEMTRNPEQTFIDLRNRLRYPGIPDVKFMGASNPGGVGHGYVKKFFITRNTDDPEQKRFMYVHANVYDNKYIDKDYVKQLESLPTQQRKAYLEGSWDVFAGQFFDEWSEKLHVINPFIPQEGVLIVGGLDWGRANPFALHLSVIEKVFYEEMSFYRARTFYEAHGTNKLPEEWSNDIKTDLRKFNITLNDISWVRADPKIFSKGDDGSISIRDQFVAADDRWRIIKPANNDRISGWNIIHNWLSLAPDGLPYWQVTNNNRALIEHIPNLIHDENIVEDVETTRKYGIDDDDADAMRYQFKHLKWIDAKHGAVKENRIRKGFREEYFAPMNDQGQLAIDTTLFR